MTTSTHDPFADSVPAYALGAFDAVEREAFEAHLAACAACQRDLADLRRVTDGIGRAVDPAAPPAALKSRVMAAATRQPVAPVVMPAPPPGAATATPPTRGVSFEWLAAAAGVALAVGAGLYAWSLRSQLHDVNQTVTELSERANSLRNNLDEARRESARLSRVVDIVRAPGTVLVNLTGTSATPGALGRAYFNPARGLVVSTEQMPALRPGRAYQLWMVPHDQKPISAGVFSVSTDGTATFLATVPATFSLPAGASVTVAVTEEPAGGSDGPTSAILIAGEMKAR